MKSDIVDCGKRIDQVDTLTSARISLLETENNLLHKKLNRCDFVISGLPVGVKSITDVVIELGAFYGVPITLQDINLACFISGKGPLNSAMQRDEIMSRYFRDMKTHPLKIADIVVDPDVLKESIDKRVFLNDHYSPAAGRLNTLCRKLLKDKIIRKFKLINANQPRAAITLSNKKEVEYNAVECAALRDGVPVL